MKLRIVSIFSVVMALSACSSVSDLPKVQNLGTQGLDHQYYYCESCDKPTALTRAIYQPLLPDEPIKVITPVVEAESAPIVKKPVYKKRRYKHQSIKKMNKPKQCIQWK